MKTIRNLYLMFLLLVLSTSAYSEVPAWSVNPNDFAYNMTLTGVIYVDGEESRDNNDIIAAFIGDVCVGVANPVYNTIKDRFVYYLMIYSNQSDAPVSFKIYDASDEVEITVQETLNFSINEIIGQLDEPYVSTEYPLNTTADFKSFFVSNQIENTLIGSDRITIYVSEETDISSLSPVFELDQYSVARVNGLIQYSGVSVQNFTEPILYEVRAVNGSNEKSYQVEVLAGVSGQSICYNTIPDELEGIPFSDGDIVYTYQWQHSFDGVNFVNISGATDLNYQPSALTETRYYRLLQTPQGSEVKITNNIKITVKPEFKGGSIMGDQEICFNTLPDKLIGLAPTGGVEPYNYQWQSSMDNVAFYNIAEADSLNFQPGVIGTTYFRLVQSSSSGCGQDVTNTVLVKVSDEFTVGSISENQTIFVNMIPAELIGVAPSGGSNEYSYQWQSSNDGVSFINIEGATNLNYQPEALTTSTFYRQLQFSDCGSELATNVVKIEVVEKHTPDGWEITPSNYAYEGEVNAEVFIDDVNMGAGILAAFVGDECRGVSDESIIGPTGKLIFVIRVYSNNAEGESVRFKFLEPNTADEIKKTSLTIFNIIESVAFVSDMLIGDAVEPFAMNAYTSIEQNTEMTSGWNWFSTYVVKEDMSLDNMLASLNPQVGDYIKDRKGTGNSAQYYDYPGAFTGWSGTLTELDPKESYKIQLKNGGQLNIEGQPLDYESAAISVESGWNWIGFPHFSEMSVTDYIKSLNVVDGDYLKDQINSTIYYDDINAWYGQLESMHPGNGYVLKVANQGVITRQSALKDGTTEFYIEDKLNFAIKDYKLEPSKFEFSGSALIEVVIDEANLGSEDNILYAFNQNDVCVGTINGIKYPVNDKYLYNLMMFSNDVEGDKIHFKFYDSMADKWYAFEETIDFKADMIIADAYHPFELKDIQEAPIGKSGVNLHPNPFSSKLNIQFVIKDESFVKVSIYDLEGRLIKILCDQLYSLGNYSLKWNAEGVSEGLYYLKIENGSSTETYKLIKLK